MSAHVKEPAEQILIFPAARTFSTSFPSTRNTPRRHRIPLAKDDGKDYLRRVPAGAV
jgi:hypothetical protein